MEADTPRARGAARSAESPRLPGPRGRDRAVEGPGSPWGQARASARQPRRPKKRARCPKARGESGRAGGTGPGVRGAPREGAGEGRSKKNRCPGEGVPSVGSRVKERASGVACEPPECGRRGALRAAKGKGLWAGRAGPARGRGRGVQERAVAGPGALLEGLARRLGRARREPRTVGGWERSRQTRRGTFPGLERGAPWVRKEVESGPGGAWSGLSSTRRPRRRVPRAPGRRGGGSGGGGTPPGRAGP